MFGFGNKKRLQQTEQELSSLRTELTSLKAAEPVDVNNDLRLTDIEELSALFGIEGSFAGPPVTAETAMKSAAVYSCTRIIAGAIASLPLPVFQRMRDGRERVDHPVWMMINEKPTPLLTAAVFWEYMVAAMLLRGDGFAWIVRNAIGDPVELLPFHPGDVIVDKKAGRFVYYINDDGRYFGVDQDDMLHLPGLGFDLKRGRSLSVIGHAARQAIGIALAAEEYSSRFFSNGAKPDVVIKAPGKMSSAQQEELRAYWLRKHQGLSNSHLPAVLTEGLDIKELTLSAQDSQLLQSRQFQVIDIARAFGVPPHLIGETEKTTSWGSGVEHMSIGFVRFTLRPHLTRIEQELNRKLFATPRHFTEFNTEGLMRGDSQAEAKYFREALGGSQGPGWMTQNEVRRIKNLPPVPNGDALYNPNAAKEGAHETTD